MEYRKKLIEVALPLKAINDESSHRKRKAPAGYPTTLHKWWAQRPLAACRGVLFASLVDDPDSDPTFIRSDGSVDEERAGIKRAELFNLIEELVLWENSNNPRVINKARAEIARSIVSRKIQKGELGKDTVVNDTETGTTTAWDIHLMGARPDDVNRFLVEYGPPVLDPFCGGGSIPLEAQRLGMLPCASDLNPIPVLIAKALVEIPQRFSDVSAVSSSSKGVGVETPGEVFKKDVLHYANWMSKQAYTELREQYPPVAISEEDALKRPELSGLVGKSLPVVAWLWARTVESPNPACRGQHVPLVSSYWLSTKRKPKTWLRPSVDSAHNSYSFSVCSGTPSREESKAIASGTKIGRGCKFRCLLSGEPIPEEHVKAEGMAGRLGVRLMAMVAEGPNGRVYVNPSNDHESVALTAKVDADLATVAVPIADDKRALWCVLYGLTSFDTLFTRRQLLAATTLTQLIAQVREKALIDAESNNSLPDDSRGLELGGTGKVAYADAIATFLAFAVSRALDYNSSLSSWRPKDNAMRSSLSKQGFPMVWDFAEANPFEKSSSGFLECAKVVTRCLDFLPRGPEGIVRQLDATASVGSMERPVVSTDPPYYDNIGYADLSDFFYVWLRQSLVKIFPSLFSTLLTPKTQELIASPYRHDGRSDTAKEFFESGLIKAFENIRKLSSPEYPVTVYYAFKQTEKKRKSRDSDGDIVDAISSTGWETMLV